MLSGFLGKKKIKNTHKYIFFYNFHLDDICFFWRLSGLQTFLRKKKLLFSAQSQKKTSSKSSESVSDKLFQGNEKFDTFGSPQYEQVNQRTPKYCQKTSMEQPEVKDCLTKCACQKIHTLLIETLVKMPPWAIRELSSIIQWTKLFCLPHCKTVHHPELSFYSTLELSITLKIAITPCITDICQKTSEYPQLNRDQITGSTK